MPLPQPSNLDGEVAVVTGPRGLGIKFMPMKLVAEVREIRSAAIFLAPAASDYVIGQMLVLDGGVLAK